MVALARVSASTHLGAFFSSQEITGAGLRESHVHDVMITREAPNYRQG